MGIIFYKTVPVVSLISLKIRVKLSEPCKEAYLSSRIPLKVIDEFIEIEVLLHENIAAKFSFGFVVMCPCHGWKFDVRKGQYLEIPQIKLESCRCKIEDGKVLVEIQKSE